MSKEPLAYQRFFAELKRRKVFRVAAAYGAVAFGVIQVADPIAGAMRLPESFLPVVIALLLLGFPLAVVLAWAFEVTPEGVQRARDGEPAEIARIVAESAAKRWTAGLLALGGVAVLLVGAWFAGRGSILDADPGSVSDDASIAVLPFANMSADPDQAYFAEGISEELLNLLAGIPELRVAARTSSFSFQGQDLEITEIAERLNVAHVLEGSVRKAGDRVRITAQLIRAEDGFHLWSDTWDRTLDDVFAIQDEIATDVTDQLRVTILGETPTVEETDPETYNLVLRARHIARGGSKDDMDRAVELLREALTIDPGYAAAWSDLAIVHLARGKHAALWDSVAPLAEDAAERALAADPGHAVGHSILGAMAQIRADIVGAIRHHQRALSLEPGNPRVLNNAAIFLLTLGRMEEAMPILEHAAARDPLNVVAHANLALAYLGLHRPVPAEASIRRALELEPDAPASRSILARALLGQGRAEEALVEIRKEPSDVWRLIGEVMVHHGLGQNDASDAALNQLIQRHPEGAAYNIAYSLAYRGEVDRAFEWLDRAMAAEDPGLSEILVTPQFDVLKDDPRWEPLLERLGRSPAQLSGIELDVDLPR